VAATLRYRRGRDPRPLEVLRGGLGSRKHRLREGETRPVDP